MDTQICLVYYYFDFYSDPNKSLFSSSEYLETLGYSYGRLVNEVFFQLSFVSIIIVALIYFENKSYKLAKFLSSILILECLVLLGFAFKSDFDYVYYWGLTHKRLYRFVIIVWLTGIYILLYNKVLSMKKINYSFWLGFYTFILLIGVNIVNFDNLIYNSPPKESDGVVYEYLENLSPDSQNLADSFSNYKEKTDNIPKNGINKYYYSNINQSVIFLQQKYGNSQFDWRVFNYSEYEEYQKVKNLKTIDNYSI